MVVMTENPLICLLSKTVLCARLDISARTVENLVKAGRFPPPVRIGKYVYWSEKSISGWQMALFEEQEAWVGT
jgi:prophage regulatory protein